MTLAYYPKRNLSRGY